jgi:cellulose biosynthesis protein BcsQ
MVDLLYAINQDDKDKTKNLMLPIFNLSYKENNKVKIDITVNIYDFDDFLKLHLSAPDAQELWKGIKERFGKDIDEQELYEVFKFFVVLTIILIDLQKALKILPSNILGLWGYKIYKGKDLFEGKLDFETFYELIRKIAEYYEEEFLKKNGQNK